MRHMYNSALELGIEVAHLRLHAEHAEHGPILPITRAIKVRKVLQAMFLFAQAERLVRTILLERSCMLFPQQM